MTTRGRRVAAAGLLLAVLTIGSTRARADERFRLVVSPTAPALGRQLAAARADGYRVVSAAQGTAISGKDRFVVLLERAADAANYDYVVVKTSGDFDELVDGKSINDWAAEGYRFSNDNMLTRRIEDWWVPDAAYDEPVTLILERPPDVAPLRYSSLRITSREHVDQDLLPLRADGRVVGMWNAGRALFVIVEEPLRQSPGAPRAQPDGEGYRLLIGTNRLTFEKVLGRAVKRGYRIEEVVEQSINAPPMVLLKRDPRVGKGLDIQFMFQLDRKIYREKLEKKLNKKARKGYRVAVRTITASTVALEREHGTRVKAHYLALSSKQPPGLPRALADAAQRGYRVIALLTNADETIVVAEGPALPEPEF